MPIFVYDMNRIDAVVREHRSDYMRLHCELHKLKQVQLHIELPSGRQEACVHILLPESDILIFRCRIKFPGIEWATRQFLALQQYDKALLSRMKPVFVEEEAPPAKA